ncbi:hypothetical protein D1224_13640 [Henriciella barbarensis]|uniref:DUF2178 domain-containing protein n=1 Tax=Henriciella barbarensis TaxID=86342 RepID=A0A399QSY3_9PROT|nr:hypothetical protein [Henriciella barbarensis]RIJ21354.1 hypothetical protein D1224_13640 [Henriciella barbarensis]
MSFREKFNWIIIVATTLTLGALGYWYVRQMGAGSLTDSAGPVIVAYIGWVVLMTIGAIVIAARDPKDAEAPGDERDRIVNMKAALPTMHFYGFALTGLILLVFVFDFSKWDALYAIVAIQLAATLIEAAARIRFYQMAV